MGTPGDLVEDCGRAVRRLSRSESSILLNHYLGRFDDGSNSVALFELEFFGAAARDGALDQIVSDPNHDVGHDIAEFELFDFAT